MTERQAALSQSARRLLNEAGRAWREGRVSEAAEHCREALVEAPQHAGARNLAGMIAHKRGDTGAALRHLEAAASLDPGNLECRQNLALVLLDTGDAVAALAHLDAVLAEEPDNRQAMELRAEALAEAGELEQAMAAWRAVLDADPAHPTAETRLLDLVGRIDPARTNPALDSLLESLLESERVEPNLLAIPLARRIMARHGLDQAPDDPPVDELAADGRLVRSLKTLYFTEPAFDGALTSLRRRLLLGCREQGRVPGAWLKLIGALAAHNLRCEYVHAAGDDEVAALTELASGLERKLEEKEISPAALTGPLLLVSMYRPPNGLAGAARLAEIPAEDFPEPARRLVRMAFLQPVRERELAAAIPSLGDIREGTSAAVREMYEAHPYPRWERLGPVAPGSVAERVQFQLPDYRAPDFAAGRRVDVLIAGCGTGRHALRAAREYENARVLAMDISGASLGYAARKAEELGVRNVEFLQADLFDLPRLERRFQVIETIGTLETLDDPEAGWRVLSEMLVPGGLMYVGSYSEVARRPVVRARELIRDLGLEGADEEMRAFRKRVFDGELGEEGRMLLRCGDFYSMSGCRDFLFHVRETRFTIRRLSELWSANGLRFLGFHPVRPPLRQAYLERFPGDPMLRDLDNWMRFEEQEPEEFCRQMNLSMLYYWLEKNG